MLAVSAALGGVLRAQWSAGPWLPIAYGSGLLTAWILLRGDSLFIAYGVGITLGRLQLGMPLLDASVVGAAAVLQAAVMIAVLRLNQVDTRFTQPRELLLLAIAAATGGLIRAAAEHATAGSLYGIQPDGLVFGFVLVSHSLGTAVGLPAVTTLVSAGWLGRLNTPDRHAWGTVTLAAAAAAITAFVFCRPDTGAAYLLPVALAVVPLLMWVSLRGGEGIGVMATAIVISIATFGTSRGLGPFTELEAPRSLLHMQALAGGLGMAALLVHTLEMNRRAAQRALEEREARLQRVIEASNDGVWEWTAVAERVEVSERAARMLALPSGTGVIAAFDAVETIHANDREGFLRAADEHAAGRSPGIEAELRVRAADGEWRWLLCRGRVAARSPEGEPLVISGTLTDIHERKIAEAERESQGERRLQSQKLESLGLLAGSVAHDFNNILTGVLGHADLARDELPSGSPVRVHIDRVVAGARGAAELTRQMLAYAGQTKVEPRLVDLSQLVAEMGHLLQVSISRRNQLRYEFAPALPAVQGDPAQLRQVIMNLILNAAEALEERDGTIVVHLSAGHRSARDLASAWSAAEADAPEPGPYVTLEVRDEGVGMDGRTLERIFDPFFSTKFTGRGLGLATVLGIVRAHRGVVQVDSAPGRGTTFRVMLPAQTRHAAPAPSTPSPDSTALTGTVLVVDDEAVVRNLASAMLRRMGAQPMPVASGALAMAALAEHGDAIRLALVDATMPSMNGPATVAALREQQPGLAVIAMSGWLEASWESDDAMAPDAFLPKPFDLRSLSEAARAALAARARGEGGGFEAPATSEAPDAPPRTRG